MKAIVPAEQEAQTSQICKKTTLFLLSWLATSGVTDVQLWNNQVSHEMTVLSNCRLCRSSETCKNKCAHVYYRY